MITTRQKKTSTRVVVGLNGSISSYVAAFLLKKQGFDILACSVLVNETEEELDSIKRFCDGAHIPFSFVEARDQYFAEVIDPFIGARLSGVKSSFLFDTHLMLTKVLKLKMDALGADYIATGHFAKVQKLSQRDLFSVQKGVEVESDKSYLLSSLDSSLLKYCLFPLGELKKVDAKKIADRFKIKASPKSLVLTKKLGETAELKKIITENVASSFIQKGSVLDAKSQAPLGNHNGIVFHESFSEAVDFEDLGIRQDDKTEITAFDRSENTIFVGAKENLSAKFAHLVNLNLNSLGAIDQPLNCFFKIDTQPELFKGTIYFKSAGGVVIEFEESAYPLAQGIRILFYDREGRNGKLLGHGFVARTGDFYLLNRAQELRSSNEQEGEMSFLGF